MTEKQKRIIGVIADHFNALLVLVYAGVTYYLVCMVLDYLVPRAIVTSRTSQDFWVFGVAAFAFCMGAFAMLKIARNKSLSRVQQRSLRAIGILLEGFVFIGAIVLWIEAGQYVSWVGGTRGALVGTATGTDTRYWIATMLASHGVAGNLLSALITA